MAIFLPKYIHNDWKYFLQTKKDSEIISGQL
jgi:hypothetical protein